MEPETDSHHAQDSHAVDTAVASNRRSLATSFLKASFALDAPKVLPHLNENTFPTGRRRMVFILMILTGMVVNYDSGALAAIYGDKGSKGIIAKFDLSKSEQGLLSSIVYLGLTAGCAASGTLLHFFHAKHLLQLSLILNAGMAWLFAFAPNLRVLYVARFFCGLSQAMLAVYCPVWVDEFAPPKYMSTWLSIIQAGTPLGIMVGYLASGFVMANTSLTWSWCFYFQAIALSPLVLVFLFVPHHYINTRSTATTSDLAADEFGGEKVVSPRGCWAGNKDPRAPAHIYDDTPSNLPCDLTNPSFDPRSYRASPEKRVGTNGTNSPLMGSFASAERVRRTRSARDSKRMSKKSRHSRRAQPLPSTDVVVDFSAGLKTVLRNPVVWAVLLCLSSLYFVVTGLQMWVTDYLTSTKEDGPIHAKYNAVVAAFGICSVTGPIAGVLVGGTLLDKVGGYRGYLDRACLVGVVFGVFAVGFAYASLFCTEFIPFIVCIWFLLFFGGGVVPPATGALVAAVDKDLRGLVSSVGGLTYNLFGYFLGPLACGVVADHYSLVWGFRVVMGWSVLAALGMIIAYLFARRKVKQIKGGVFADPESLRSLPLPDTPAELVEPALSPEALRDALLQRLSVAPEEIKYHNVKTRGPITAPARMSVQSQALAHSYSSSCDGEADALLGSTVQNTSFVHKSVTAFYRPPGAREDEEGEGEGTSMEGDESEESVAREDEDQETRPDDDIAVLSSVPGNGDQQSEQQQSETARTE